MTPVPASSFPPRVRTWYEPGPSLASVNRAGLSPRFTTTATTPAIVKRQLVVHFVVRWYLSLRHQRDVLIRDAGIAQLGGVVLRQVIPPSAVFHSPSEVAA